MFEFGGGGAGSEHVDGDLHHRARGAGLAIEDVKWSAFPP